MSIAETLRRARAAVGVIKKRFPNLTAEEAMDLAMAIMMAQEEATQGANDAK